MSRFRSTWGLLGFAGQLLWLAVFLGLGSASPELWGQAPTAADIAGVIDREVGRKLQGLGLSPAPPSSDAAFARRLYLDLHGCLPTLEQLDRFLADRAPDKRARLIDQLLNSPRHAEHFAAVFDTMLMGRNERKLRARRERGWLAYLERVFSENRPWDQVAGEILLARADAGQRGHLWFLYERENNHQAIAESVARSFFGVDIACAQCHDHLVAEEIKQAHYWGLVGFFKRSKNGQTDRGIAIEESAIGGFDDYANPLLGTTESLELTFLLSGTVDETRPADPAAQADDEALYVLVEGEPRVPRFSRREKFVSEILADHPLVAPAMVNRLWGLLMGRGLVHPIERMDSSNRPSHPELLDELAADFRGQGYDIRRLVRGIVLSEAYQRSADSQGRSLPVDAYAVAMVKPLSAEAYGASVQIALADADAAEADPSWEKLAVHWRTFFPEVIATSDQATIDQALGLTNGSQFNDVLRQSAANWVAATVGLTLEQQVQLAYRRCFARLPESEELAQVQAFLAARSDRAVDGWTQVFWTLVTAAEFRFNH